MMGCKNGPQGIKAGDLDPVKDILYTWSPYHPLSFFPVSSIYLFLLMNPAWWDTALKHLFLLLTV